MLHRISNFEVKITEISEFEFATVIASIDLVVWEGGGLRSNSNMPSDSHHRGGNPFLKFDIGSDRDTDQAPR